MYSEEQRLNALYQLNLLDTPPSESFDRITRMAAQIFNLPIAAISLTDTDRQLFMSRVGVAHQSISRDRAPCAQVAVDTAPLLITDMSTDEAYADSPLANSGVRFYAGAPLVTPEGYGLGALCVLGSEPRLATAAEMKALADLASIVMSQIELRHAFGRVDVVSGLPNRRQLLEDLEDLARDHPGQRRLFVVVDLARSDQLEDGLRVMGSAFIDNVVKEAAESLQQFLGRTRRAYHVGTTLLAFLAVPGVDEASYADRLDAMLEFVRDNTTSNFVMTVAVGVAPFIAGHTASVDVLRAAHSAALDSRASRVAISYNSVVKDDEKGRRFALVHDFGDALKEQSQLRIVYQPRVDLRTGLCVGAEALLRWRHPTLGEVSPAEFIPVIEQTTMIRQATAYVVNEAVGELSRWAAAGLDLRMSVNISVTNLEEGNFAEYVRQVLDNHSVTADRLELEVTESAVMGNAELALARLDELAASGVRIAIDDFGTGYSSLAYLQRMPVHFVKIDHSFIRELANGGERELTLVRSMISLSQGLQHRVVAEGVESAETADLLRAMGRDEAQGYYFAPPLKPAAFIDWMLASENVLAQRYHGSLAKRTIAIQASTGFSA